MYVPTIIAIAVNITVTTGGTEGKAWSCISPTTPDVILPPSPFEKPAMAKVGNEDPYPTFQ